MPGENHMALRLKGHAPKRGESDARYYMIDVQVAHRRVRLSTGTRKLDLAQRKEQQILDALRDNEYVPDEALRDLIRGRSKTLQAVKAQARNRTLKVAMDEAMSDRNFWAKRKSLSTIRSNCKVVQQYLGADRQINTITQAVLNTTLDRMEADRLAPATINRKMQCLFSVLKREAEAGTLVTPIPKFKPASERQFARKFVLSREDEALLLQNVLQWNELPDIPGTGRERVKSAQDYHDLFVVLADVGCRVGQAFLIRWDDITTGLNGRLQIRFWRLEEQKGGHARTLPLTTRAQAVLERRRRFCGDDAGPFTYLDRWRAGKYWQFAKKGTHLENVKDCVIHSLRHTCATRLLSKTGDIRLAQEWLGHRDIKTTASVYAHVLDGQKQQGLAALEAALQETEKGDNLLR
jgi:integrase